MWTLILLTASNIFMTFAWYGHLKFFKGDDVATWKIILFSWAIAFCEYCLMVPANRLGKHLYNWDTAQLKTIQEVITLLVFAAFSVFFLREAFQWRYVVGFAFILIGATFIFNPLASKASKAAAVSVETPAVPVYASPDKSKEM